MLSKKALISSFHSNVLRVISSSFHSYVCFGIALRRKSIYPLFSPYQVVFFLRRLPSTRLRNFFFFIQMCEFFLVFISYLFHDFFLSSSFDLTTQLEGKISMTTEVMAMTKKILFLFESRIEKKIVYVKAFPRGM